MASIPRQVTDERPTSLTAYSRVPAQAIYLSSFLSVGADMRRREFIAFFGGAAAAWPLEARAQQPTAMPVVGFLDFGSAAERTQQVAAFRKGLTEGDYREGQNVALEFRWAE